MNKVIPVGLAQCGENPGHVIGCKTCYIENGRGQKLHCRYWAPNKGEEIRGIVFISHGFGEHLLWYEDLALQFASCGVLAFGHDHVGHGKSEGIRCHISSFDQYVDDLFVHCNLIFKEFPGLPCFLVGHSMGGMIAIRAATRNPNMFSGAVLMGPLVKPNPEEATPFKICLAKIVARILPYVSVGYLNEKKVTRDAEMRKKLGDDPLRYRGGFRAKWAMSSYDDLCVMGQSLEEIQWPFLILHGEKDELCDPEGAKEFFRRSSSKDKEIKIFPEAFHHLYLEVPEVRKQAIGDTVQWVKKRLKSVDN